MTAPDRMCRTVRRKACINGGVHRCLPRTGPSMSSGSRTGAIPSPGRVTPEQALSAGTNGLDPGCTDEAAASRFRWISTVRVGVEETIGDVDVFVFGGPALARIVNSVTDTDYSGSTCLETDLRLDADDSFRRGSTEVGWAIGAGFELPLAAR